jgi:hypothetical protein
MEAPTTTSMYIGAVERVRHRVRAGGHDVPETKVRERDRLWALVADAIGVVRQRNHRSRLRQGRLPRQHEREWPRITQPNQS